MVGLKTMPWLPEITALFSDSPKTRSKTKKSANRLGILAFETAKTMARLVSLYKSLSDVEISRLRNDVIRSEGVQFLNSRDESFLMSLASAERLEDLDRAAAAVCRLAKKCNDLGLHRFDLIYADLKLGLVDFRKINGFGSRMIEKKVHKMERLISTTSFLHAALDSLSEMEISERKLQQWKKRPIHLQMQNVNTDLFNEKIEFQRKQVRHFRKISLWSRTFDQTVRLMARIVCVVFARISAVFAPYIPISDSIPDIPHHRNTGLSLIFSGRVPPYIEEQIVQHSGPIMTKSKQKPNVVRFYSRKTHPFRNQDSIFGSDSEKVAKNNTVSHSAGPGTVGGSGLALRYANVIILTEEYLDSKESIGHDERESLYQMLPENLKALVRAKLSKNMRCAENDESLAEGWREAMMEMMRWLSPMAHNTVQWQMERNIEKTKFDAKPSVLLLQTLHFSDKEKTEAAIAEVLVGLSCILRFENRCMGV